MSVDVLHVPSNRCFWGVLSAKDGRLNSASQRYRFEAVLPIPVESLQTAAVDLSNGSVLIVGVSREFLGEMVSSLEGDFPLTARPDSIPLSIAVKEPEVIAHINFLYGDFEPLVHRRQRMFVTVLLIGVTLFAALAILMAALSEAAEHRELADRARVQAFTLADAAVPLPSGAQFLPATLRLEQELRRARQAAEGAGPESDLIPVLDALWQVWPHDIRCQIDTIGLDASRLVLRGRVPDADSAQRFAAALTQLPVAGENWSSLPLDVPRVQTDSVSVLLSFVPGDL